MNRVRMGGFGLMFLGILALWGCVGKGKHAKTVIGEHSNMVIIDVRTPREFAGGHVAGAANIPYQKIGQVIGQEHLSKKQLIYVYCATGRRAGKALKTLEHLGYVDVINGGTVASMTKLAAKLESKGTTLHRLDVGATSDAKGN